ncbi:MAG: DUF4175 domain-containing protein, partial [bacterium]|nr:DUF4175 domain-containing protein [bacterium]
MQKVVVSRRNFIVASFCVVALLSLPSSASAQSDGALSKVFTPDTIGPGNVSTITFTITNSGAAPITGVQFTDVLPVVPGAMIIADPGNASTTCDLGASGSLSAPDGGGTIALSEAQLGAGVMWTVTVDVTASTPGVHTNPAIMLEYNELGGDPPTSSPVDLTVVTTLPGFSKSFAPSSVPLGDRSTLTFTVDNTANASAVVNLDFTDNLPAGMLVADPANASTDCNSPNPALITTLTSVPGTSAIILDANGLGFGGLEVLPAGATCTVTVDVTTTGAGMLDNVTQDLLATGVSCGKASDTLDVSTTAIALQKSFTDDPVAPGATTTLDFNIDNFDRNYSATGVAFTDDLTTAVAGLTFDSLLSNDCGGSVAGAGTTTITFTGGNMAPQGTCTISVSLSVPLATAPGIYTNTTGAISGTVNGSPVVGNMASDDLYVEPIPVLTKEFLEDGTLNPDPVINAGDDVVLRFTVTNTSTTSMATDVEFLDELTDGSAGIPPDLTSGFLPFPVTVTLPPVPDPPCGAGSSLALVSRGTERQALELTGGSLAASPGPGDSCSFDVTLSIPSDFTPGIHLNTTEEPTATVDGATRVGSPASDTLTVISAPTLSKEFTDDPVAPGDTVTLEFTLSYPPDASGDATVISFTDDLAPVLAGLTANLPSTPDPPCGVGSSLTGSAGDTLLTLLGGTLSPGESCAFSVTLDVPAGAAPGSYTNTTSGVSATVAGEAATSAPASDDLDIQGLTFTKEFLGDPVVPGDAVPLRFTIENTHPTEDATDIDFTDNLAAVLPGVPDLSATLPPVTNTCGGADSGGPTSLNYAGGSLLTGLTCTIEYDVLVPAGAADGTYLNVTSNLTATQGGAVTVDPATDDLTVNSNLLYLTKEFTDDPVAPGGTVTLEFNLTNLDAGQAASAIGFTDDLNVTLTGLTFDSVLLNTCGGTVVGTGTTLITVSGASLAASGTCTIQASLSVPGGAAANVYTNTTSDVTGTIGGFPVSGDAASDDLEITQLLEFSKSFDGPTTATGMATLTFTITNPGANTATDISFSDNLDAVITGLVATSLPALPCGAGSSITGIGFLTFTGGELPPTGGTCSFDVDVLVPATATAGTFLNTTSDLEQAGLYVADPATADLVIEPPPTFAKSFAPNPIVAGAISTLTFTIDNSLSALDASALDFTDNLPAGVVVATPSGASTTCTGGTLTAAAGTGTITYTGGTVGAGATCTVTVDTAGIVPGGHLNTTEDLTSSSGNSGPASDTLTVTAPPPPTFAKVFTPDTIAIGGISTLTFTIDNTTALVPATRLAFTDNLPVAVQIATPNNAGTTCTGGTLTATAGTSVITYTGGTVAAIATCTVSVDVTSSTPGTHVNLSGNLTSSSGTSGTATDNLVVVPVPGFSKVFAPNPVPFNGTSVLTFTIDNTGSVLDATALDFTD